jgi:FKBP-type peptidyl-prolyl cis-trans isomerase FklB
MLLAIPAAAAEEPALKTDKDKANYGIGVSVGRNFKQQGMEVDVDLVVQGLRDVLAGKKLLLSDEELRKIMRVYHGQLRQKQMQQRMLAGTENRKAGTAFQEANKKKKGVMTLKNGLQILVLTEGKGPKPTAKDTVEIIYRGSFINGEEFDASGPEAKTFEVAKVIKGWREALPLMPVGSKWQLVVPPELAYADKGLGQVIMPNTTLIFEMELVAIKPPAAPKAEKPQAPAEKK